MGWRGRTGGTGAMAFAERRLVAVARQWRVPPAAQVPGDAPTAYGLPAARPWEAIAAPDGSPGRGRAAPWSRSAIRGLAVLVALAVAVAGYSAWSGRPRAVAVAPSVLAAGTPLPGAAVEVAASAPARPASSAEVLAAGSPAPQPDPIPLVVVHVTGLVARPGLVRLPVGSRVADAVAEAGGVTRRRAADTVNLARVLVDGEQVVVGSPGAASASTPVGAAQAPVSAPVVVDLNAADVPALDALPGIGPVLAGRIVAWRAANGAFRSVDELGEVSGIGDAVLTQVRDLVRV